MTCPIRKLSCLLFGAGRLTLACVRRWFWLEPNGDLLIALGHWNGGEPQRNCPKSSSNRHGNSFKINYHTVTKTAYLINCSSQLLEIIKLQWFLYFDSGWIALLPTGMDEDLIRRPWRAYKYSDTPSTLSMDFKLHLKWDAVILRAHFFGNQITSLVSCFDSSLKPEWLCHC